MTTTEMLNAIREKKQFDDNKVSERKRKVCDKNARYMKMAKQLIGMYGNDMMLIVNELQDSGFYLLTDAEVNIGARWSEFITNGISHKIGFYSETPKYYYRGRHKIVGFGIECGGCCGDEDLLFDLDGNILKYGERYSDGSMVTLYRFVDGFEEFVDDFYKYVEKNYIRKN